MTIPDWCPCFASLQPKYPVLPISTHLQSLLLDGERPNDAVACQSLSDLPIPRVAAKANHFAGRTGAHKQVVIGCPNCSIPYIRNFRGPRCCDKKLPISSGEPQRYRRCLPSLKIGIGSEVRERLLWSTTQLSFTFNRLGNRRGQHFVREWRRRCFLTLLTITHASSFPPGISSPSPRRSTACTSSRAARARVVPSDLGSVAPGYPVGTRVCLPMRPEIPIRPQQPSRHVRDHSPRFSGLIGLGRISGSVSCSW